MNNAELLSQSDGIPRFAHANGWRYDPTASPPAVTGLWEQVSQGVVRDRVSGVGWEAGHITGGDRRAQTVENKGGWTVTKTVSVSTPRNSISLGYLAITLPRRLPHMILDATANDRGPFSSLINRPRSDQAMSLEGDFNRHFRLYAPRGYEQDALYVFTPDLMSLLIDETGDLDVEIRDDRLIVYKPGGFDMRHPATWHRFESIRATLGHKAWTQTDMYSDERVDAPPLLFAGPGENTVDDQGRRLRKRLPLFARIAIAAGAGTILLFGAIAVFVLSRVFGW